MVISLSSNKQISLVLLSTLYYPLNFLIYKASSLFISWHNIKSHNNYLNLKILLVHKYQIENYLKILVFHFINLRQQLFHKLLIKMNILFLFNFNFIINLSIYILILIIYFEYQSIFLFFSFIIFFFIKFHFK